MKASEIFLNLKKNEAIKDNQDNQILGSFLNKKLVTTNQIKEQVNFRLTIILNMKVTLIEIKNLSVKEYLDKFKAYWRDKIIYLQNSDPWIIQL